MKKQIAIAELPSDFNTPDTCHVAVYKVNRRGETTEQISRSLVGDHAAAVRVAKSINEPSDEENVVERAIGRLFSIMAGPPQDSDDEEYEKCRRVIMSIPSA